MVEADSRLRRNVGNGQVSRIFLANAPAQPRRTHVPAEMTPPLPPAGGCSGLFGGSSHLRMPLAAMRTSRVRELAPPDQNRSGQ